MKFSSIFSQLLQLFPRLEFEQAVKKHQAERSAKSFTSWGQFIAMLFCQLGRAHSLREICGGLASCEGKLKHLGIPIKFADEPGRLDPAWPDLGADGPAILRGLGYDQAEIDKLRDDKVI